MPQVGRGDEKCPTVASLRTGTDIPRGHHFDSLASGTQAIDAETGDPGPVRLIRAGHAFDASRRRWRNGDA
ncbi:hypothetical protein GCM10009740_13840 [Terrabacter terrae]|uniref:Uncharacterized protein n=1 Tax=Terrabacter terrae TaxID=318434 RepID=A0ABN2U003_9MICO